MALTTLTKIGKGITSLFKAKGATHARFLEDRFSDVVNVMDFGAKGDGVEDDTESVQTAINSLKQGQVLGLPSGLVFRVSNLILKGADGNLGLNGIKGINGYATLMFTGDNYGLQITGSTSPIPHYNWYSLLENIRFTSTEDSNIHTYLLIGGGDTQYGTCRKCIFEGRLGKTIQNVCMTNDSVEANRDYYYLFDNCVMRNSKYHIVGGGDWSSGVLVRCKQAVNRVRLRGCDFYEHTEYGLAVYGTGSDASNGWMISQHHTDHSSNAKGDFYFTGNGHQLDGFFESHAACLFETDSVDSAPNCNVGQINYTVIWKVNGVAQESGSFPSQNAVNGVSGYIETYAGGGTQTIKQIRTTNLSSGTNTRLRLESGHVDEWFQFSKTTHTNPQSPTSELHYTLGAYGFLPETSKSLGSTTKKWANTYTDNVYCSSYRAGDNLRFQVSSGHADEWFQVMSEDSQGSRTLQYTIGKYGILPATSSSVSLGAASNKWKDAYLQNNPIVGSDERIKYDIQSIPQQLLDFAMSVEIKQYKLKDGTSKRTHYGIVITQEFLDELDSVCKVDTCAAICHDVFIDSKGNPFTQLYGHTQLGDLWQVRYAEWQNILLESIRRKIKGV